MKHAFGIDGMSCPRCKGRMRFVTVLFDRDEIKRLLTQPRLFSDPLPNVHSARAPPDSPDTLDFP